MSSRKFWYYDFDGIEFTGFHHCHPEDIKGLTGYDMATGGPFDTFSEAKGDALERARCDLAQARSTVKDIQATRKADSL